MRILGKKAIYKGKEYRFNRSRDGEYSILSKNEADVKLGFEKIDENVYIKYVSLEELDFVFEKVAVVKYRGDEFIASFIEKDKIMLYTLSVELGKKYQMIERNRFEYFLYVDLKEIEEIVQR